MTKPDGVEARNSSCCSSSLAPPPAEEAPAAEPVELVREADRGREPTGVEATTVGGTGPGARGAREPKDAMTCCFVLSWSPPLRATM